MPKQRLQAFDVAKGIAMIAVIVGHTGIGAVGTPIAHSVFTWHLPLFLVVSGWFDHGDDLGSAFWRKGFASLVLPYVATGIVIVLGNVVKAALTGGDPIAVAVEWGMATLCAYGGTNKAMLVPARTLGATWFLLALLWCRVLMVGVRRLERVSEPLGLLAIMVGVLVAVRTKDLVWLPWDFQPALACLPFVWFGWKARQHDLIARTPRWAYALMALVAAYVTMLPGLLCLVDAAYGNGAIADTAGGLCAALVILRLCMAAEAHGVLAPLQSALAMVGRNSLCVLCMHLVEGDCIRLRLLGHGFATTVGMRLAMTAALCCLAWAIPLTRSIWWPRTGRKGAGQGETSRG